MRLRGEDVKPSPRVTATVADSIALPRIVLSRMERTDARVSLLRFIGNNQRTSME
jgi:hypothetical protein